MIDYGFKDKVAIVTGAGGEGFGTGICKLLAEEGAHVVANDMYSEVADKVAADLCAIGPKAIATYADVTKYDQCDEMAKKAKAEFGRIDYLVTVPFWMPYVKFLQARPQDDVMTVAVTYLGVVNCVRAVLPTMVEQSKGSIVAIGSDAMRVGESKQIVYGGAKAAVLAFARGMTREHARDNIRMNVVNPGMTVKYVNGTPILPDEMVQKAIKWYPLGRLTKPDDVVNAISFLLSDKASFITGQVLPVSGGYQCI